MRADFHPVLFVDYQAVKSNCCPSLQPRVFTSIYVKLEILFLIIHVYKEISVPAGTGRVTLVISVAGFLLKTGESSGNVTHTIDIPFNLILFPNGFGAAVTFVNGASGVIA